MPQELICQTEDDLNSIAKTLINEYPNARVFALYADMGVGKTTFIKAVAKSLNIPEIVTSPTFSIVNQYNNNAGISIYHFDFYRIKNIQEAYDIGYEDYFYSGDYCFIEWPELISPLLPDNTIKIKIMINQLNGYRIFTF